MWASVVVFIHLFLCQLSDLIQFNEKIRIKDKFSVDSVLTFDVSILHRSYRLDKLDLNFIAFCPKLKLFLCELCTIVCSNNTWCTPFKNNSFQDSDDTFI
jgi:hypothetical protein